MQSKALWSEDPDPEPFARWRTGSGRQRWRLPPVVLAVVLAGCGSTGESLAAGELEAQLAAVNDPTTTIASAPTMPATIVLPLPVPAETTASTLPTGEVAAAGAATSPSTSPSTSTTAAVTSPPSTAAPTTPTMAPTTSPTTAPTSASETTAPPTTQVVAPSSTAETAPDVAVPDIVEFRIPPGTGSGPWNTFENPVRIRLGQILRVHNDDSVAHTIHANGAPFPHGNRIAPGSFRDHLVVRPSEPSAGSPRLYEHTAGRSAAFYVIATS